MATASSMKRISVWIFGICACFVVLLIVSTSHITPASTKSRNSQRHSFLTLFTSMSASGLKMNVYTNTLHNWRFLHKLNVRTVLLTNHSSVGDQAHRLGWVVLPIRHTIPDEAGTPLLPHMFIQVREAVSSDLYGFVNGDILFDRALVDSVRAIVESPVFNNTLLSEDVLITGQRTNVYNVTRKEATSWKLLSQAAKTRGKLDYYNAEDYFITTKSYPWETYPPVAIGIVSYDNWLVLRGNQLSHTLIDASQTVLAVHQQTIVDELFRRKGKNSTYNAQLLARIFGTIRWESGFTLCCRYHTDLDYEDNVVVKARPDLCKDLYSNF